MNLSCAMFMPKKNARNVLQNFTAAAGAQPTLTNFHGSITDAYDIGCEMERKRVECAIMIKAALADEE